MTDTDSQTRWERDPLGEVQLPVSALYGVQTKRALDNFQISRLRIHPVLITALAEIKKAAAQANREVGQLAPELSEAISQAADEVIAGKWHEQFKLDVFQAGAGTSYNMNVNEVIANRALEILGHARGAYTHLHPNDHVNQAQSTNDVMLTAMRIAALRLMRELLPAVAQLRDTLQAKATEFSGLGKTGRTHLHDATEMTLGQEFAAYAGNVERARRRLEAGRKPVARSPLRRHGHWHQRQHASGLCTSGGDLSEQAHGPVFT